MWDVTLSWIPQIPKRHGFRETTLDKNWTWYLAFLLIGCDGHKCSLKYEAVFLQITNVQAFKDSLFKCTYYLSNSPFFIAIVENAVVQGTDVQGTDVQGTADHGKQGSTSSQLFNPFC
jgi:hypothetical protein